MLHACNDCQMCYRRIPKVGVVLYAIVNSDCSIIVWISFYDYNVFPHHKVYYKVNCKTQFLFCH
jgi:hypothetical protein